MKKTVHVFDVDGTIIYGDSFIKLLLFTRKKIWETLWELITILPQLAIGHHQKAKEKLLRKIFLNKKKEEVESMGKQFFEHILKFEIKPTAIEKFIELNEQKIQTVLLSASCDAWLKPLAAYLSADLICTELAYNDRQFYVEKFATPNCKGLEKINRLLSKYSSDGYEFICYGNTKSDKKLQLISKAFYYRYF